jgi:hypothetical protein
VPPTRIRLDIPALSPVHRKGLTHQTAIAPLIPAAIDIDETLYRIDIRDYDWDRAIDLRRWHAGALHVPDGGRHACSRVFVDVAPCAVGQQRPGPQRARAATGTDDEPLAVRSPVLDFRTIAD